MADIFKNRYDFRIGFKLCDLEDYALQIRFYEISVELTIFRLQDIASNFGNLSLNLVSISLQMPGPRHKNKATKRLNNYPSC